MQFDFKSYEPSCKFCYEKIKIILLNQQIYHFMNNSHQILPTCNTNRIDLQTYLICIKTSTLGSLDVTKACDLSIGNAEGLSTAITTIVYIKWDC